MNRIWIIAIIEATLALIGLVAYFYGQNYYVAAGAAILMALVGIIQPFLRAKKESQQAAYVQRQWDKAEGSINAHLKEMLDKVIEPPLPDLKILEVLLNATAGERSQDIFKVLKKSHSLLSKGSSSAAKHCEENKNAYDNLGPLSALGPYLSGLASLQGGDFQRACIHFKRATSIHSSWAHPWLGLMMSEFRQEHFDEVGHQNPQLNKVSIDPFGPGDQDSWIELPTDLREKNSEEFQQVMESIGGLYAASEFKKSKAQMAENRKEMEQFS